MSIPKSFGAVELAKYCQVSRNTIHNWIRDERLKAFKLPGGHYRVEKKELLKFLQHYEMPISDELLAEEPKVKLLLVNENSDFIKNATQTLEKNYKNLEVEVAVNSMEACIKAGTFLPELIVVELDRNSTLTICKELKKNEITAATRIIVIAEQGDRELFKEIGVDKIVRKPMEMKSLEKEVKKFL